MRIKRLDRQVTDVVLIGKKTFRFGRLQDASGYTLVYADEWSGWQWIRRHAWHSTVDVLSYVAMAAEELGVSLEMIAGDNLEKLSERKRRGTLKGEGDNR